MISPDYQLPRGDVKLARGRRLHYSGKHPDPTATQTGRWKHPCGLHVVASFGPIPEIGPYIHVSLSYKDKCEVADTDVAEVALIFFPERADVFLVRGGTFGPVTHLLSEERAQGIVKGVLPRVAPLIREMLGGGS